MNDGKGIDIILRNVPNDTFAREWAEMAMHAAVSHGCSLRPAGHAGGQVWPAREGSADERHIYTYTTRRGTVVARFLTPTTPTTGRE